MGQKVGYAVITLIALAALAGGVVALTTLSLSTPLFAACIAATSAGGLGLLGLGYKSITYIRENRGNTSSSTSSGATAGDKPVVEPAEDGVTDAAVVEPANDTDVDEAVVEPVDETVVDEAAVEPVDETDVEEADLVSETESEIDEADLVSDTESETESEIDDADIESDTESEIEEAELRSEHENIATTSSTDRRMRNIALGIGAIALPVLAYSGYFYLY